MRHTERIDFTHEFLDGSVYIHIDTILGGHGEVIEPPYTL